MNFRGMISLGCFWCAAALIWPCAAEPPRAAVRSYVAGNFLAAAEIAERGRSSESLAFAARALMAQCLSAPDRAAMAPLAERAEAAARDALALDPDSVDARLQLALALGVRGRLAPLREAVAHRYAPRGRDLIEEALDRAPNEPWAHALLGGWHLEILRRGGRAGAVAYGARLNTGIAEFERARTLAPADPIILLHYAVALIQLDAERHAARITRLLEAADSMRADDAFEAHALRQARMLSVALAEGGPTAAAHAAGQAFP